MRSHASFASGMFIVAIWVGLVIGCKSGSRTNIPASSTSPSKNASLPLTGKYFDGGQACKFLANVDGFDLGAYVPYIETEGYTCEKVEPSIKLSCNPHSELLCNLISYQVDGEKEGATSAELFYMGTSLSSVAHEKDMQTFVKFSNQLAQNAVDAPINDQMRKYIFDTRNFLPMKPEAKREVIDEHTLKSTLGSGFVSILARRNDMSGGSAYMIRFTVYPDQRLE
jgi:hypothetical protein